LPNELSQQLKCWYGGGNKQRKSTMQHLQSALGPLTIARTTAEELPLIMEILDQAAQWMLANGIEQKKIATIKVAITSPCYFALHSLLIV